MDVRLTMHSNFLSSSPAATQQKEREREREKRWISLLLTTMQLLLQHAQDASALPDRRTPLALSSDVLLWFYTHSLAWPRVWLIAKGFKLSSLLRAHVLFAKPAWNAP